MEFEFDSNKSESNLAKHGIDFLTAQQLWNDLDRVEVRARTTEERRFFVIGQIDGKLWTAVVTYRKGKIRIISVRRSREKEVAAYEEDD
jgi:uncharacterized protein